MKKKVQIMWLSLLVILVAGIGSVQAAEATITWDVNSYYDGPTFTVTNAGTLWYFGKDYPSASVAGTETIEDITQTAQKERSFTAYSETTTVSGTASGSLLTNGASNTVSSEVTQSGSNIYFDQVSQTISSSIKRSFTVEANAEVTIESLIADIDTLINWAIADSGISSSSYSISASVTLLAGDVNNSSVDSADFTEVLYLNEENGYSGTITFTSSDKVVFYNLITSLTIKTNLSNFDSATGETGETLDVGSIGLTMNTTMSATSAVPVPGSMFLLFSGVSGLAAVLRRSKN